MSNKYLVEENYKSSGVSITILFFQGIKNLIRNKAPL